MKLEVGKDTDIKMLVIGDLKTGANMAGYI